ncbi:MAG: S-formylglutathione hydrolase FrmB [Rhodothermales bacterium]|jgi:S-formylglutathione hydrolase FrmB
MAKSRPIFGFVLLFALAFVSSGVSSAQSVVKVDTVLSAGLASNLVGDDPARKVLVYLPPSYREEEGRQYPVLYLLHGVTSWPEEWVDGTYQGMDIQIALDSLTSAGATPEFIVVMPHAVTWGAAIDVPERTTRKFWFTSSGSKGSETTSVPGAKRSTDGPKFE